jgi:tetratricopeptide (TPR) repeat protein
MAVNGQPRKVLTGQTVTLHPRDQVKILEISTNIPLDYGIRLTSTSIDVGDLRYEEILLSDLLPDKDIYNHYKFRVEVKHRVEVIGYMDLEVRPYVEDWLEKADRIIDKNRRLSLLKRAVSLMPGEIELMRRLADEYKTHRRWKEAAQLLEDMAKEKAEPDILEELLDLYDKDRNTKGVVLTLKRLLKINPKNIDIRIRLAEQFEKHKDLKAAAEQYESLKQYVGEDQALAVYTRLGYLYSEMGRMESAVSAYTKAIELDSKDADLYYSVSYLYERSGDVGKAEEYLAKALELKKDDIQGRLKLAEGLIEKNDLDRAKEYVQQVLDSKPDSMDALLLMVAILEKREEKEGLKEVYEKIHTLDPENDTVLYNLAALEYELGNTEESLEYFKKYLSIHPDDGEVHKILFNIYKEKDLKDSAYEHAKILVDLNKNEMGPYRYIFEYLSSKSEYEEIIKIAKKGLEFNPGNMELMEYLVTAYLKTGQDDLAVEQIEELVKARPEDIPLLLRLAKLRENRGELKEALRAYKTIIELSPGHAEAEEAYLRLRLKGMGDVNEK